jgi:hypothetical protein
MIMEPALCFYNVSAPINKVQNRVLLDIGRNKLAGICGYANWKDWKACIQNRDEILNSAQIQLTTLSPSNNVSCEWTALGMQCTALQMLLVPNKVRDRSNLAVHTSVQKHIGESVMALTVDQERKDMIMIFKAVFGKELVPECEWRGM